MGKKTGPPAPMSAPVVAIASRLDPRLVDPAMLPNIGERAAVFLQLDPGRPGAEYLRLTIQHAELAERAIRAGDIKGAVAAAMAVMHAVWWAELTDAGVRWFQAVVAPKAALGKKFSDGRKANTVSKVRLFVRRYLKRYPAAGTADVWAALKAKPPRGVEVHDTSNRALRHITTVGARDTSYRQLANLVSLERPK